MERHELHELIRLDGEFAVTSAAELQKVLLEGITTGRELQIDLERVEAIDVTVLQLLWAAEREAARRGARVAVRVSEAAARTAREAGFEHFPGLTVQG